MRKEIIRANGAPSPMGPYSQATRLGNLLFVAGQVPIDPATGTIPTDIRDQTRQTLLNVQAILEAAGTSLGNVLKTTCFLQDMADFGAFNEVYAQFFTEDPPARTTVPSPGMPLGIRVEIEALAQIP